LSSYLNLRNVILHEINAYDVVVEFVPGAIPTAHLFDVKGNDVRSFAIGDKNLEEVLALFEENGFKLRLKSEINSDPHPSSTTELGNVYYEFYEGPLNYNSAKEFASKKQRGQLIGRLISYNCSFQDKYISSWLSGLKVDSIWLSAERNIKRNLFKWIDGPLNEVYFQNKLQYSNWNSKEPNNANNDEDCVRQDSTGGWSDVSCLSVLPFVIEFGKIIVPCPNDPNHPHYDVKDFGDGVDINL